MEKSAVKIREAEGRDAPAIHELYRQLVRPVAPEVQVDVRAERIEQIKSDPHNSLWVLECEAGVVGTAFVTLCLDPMHNRQPYAVLENFVIDERYRAKGYGARLMQHAVDFCYHTDCLKNHAAKPRLAGGCARILLGPGILRREQEGVLEVPEGDERQR